MRAEACRLMRLEQRRVTGAEQMEREPSFSEFKETPGAGDRGQMRF